MYEHETPFKLEQLCEIAKFANIFCFKVIWENLIGKRCFGLTYRIPRITNSPFSNISTIFSLISSSHTDLNERRANALFHSIFQLCTILHNRDCRRSFTKKSNFWIINEIKAQHFINEFEKQTRRAQLLMSKMPHVVPLRDRMMLFRKLVTQDKNEIDLPNTVITIGRARIVEDGYRQLSNFSSQALRGTIRVRFINQQGLDEAGIDQDGVFKEFLELTLKKVFDPQLNIFKVFLNSIF